MCARSNGARNSFERYRWAVQRFDRLVGHYALVDDVTPAALSALRAQLLTEGREEKTIDDLVYAVRRVAGELDPARLPRRRRREEPLPPAAAGSVRDFFHDTYEPQAMLGCSAQHRRDCRTTLRLLFDFNGGDLPLAELTDRLAARFLQWLLDGGRREPTCNGHRARLFAMWRLARRMERTPAQPTIRRLPESVDAPDAWTEDEYARILRAPLSMRWGRAIAGISPGTYWHALLLVEYWTALRKGTLRRLTWADVDLAMGSIRVPGRAMKNRRGRPYQIGPDAIGALQTIQMPHRELVFPWPHDEQHFSRSMRRIVAAAGVAPSGRAVLNCFHKLRRSTATLVAEKRGLAAASELLGHSSVDLTRKRYIDPTRMPGHDTTAYLPVLSAPVAPSPPADATAEDDSHVRIEIVRSLAAAGNLLAAAAMVRVLLERWLRSMCHTKRCGDSKMASLLDRAKALTMAGWLTEADYRDIRRIAKPANAAVHGVNQSPATVAVMLDVLERLVTRGALIDSSVPPEEPRHASNDRPPRKNGRPEVATDPA
ncbi:MAG: tyrosine-type recombinase/integrase [Pirellulales bacterium]